MIARSSWQIWFSLGAGLGLLSFACAQEDAPTIPSFDTEVLDAIVPPSWIEAARDDRSRSQADLMDPVNLTAAYETDLIARIRRKIIDRQQQQQPEEFADYTLTVSRSDTPYEMKAIQGGTFLMGSPPEEKGRFEDEGPQREVTVSDFWMGKYEVTWPLFLPFGVFAEKGGRNKNGTPKIPDALTDPVDWVTGPTQPYTDMSFGMGNGEGYPAIGMTHHTANKFCQWLSIQSGHFYRLPTEAEWEYACRAGTTGPYSCPTEELADYAVMDPRQLRTAYEKVGTKKPNPFGLYDIHGNVLEWCLDAHSPHGYGDLPATNPWRKPAERFGRVSRGGSWYDAEGELRSARRTASSHNWQIQDPQLPKSLWWLADAQWIGIRVVRPREIPSEEEMFQIWNSGAVHETPVEEPENP